MESTPSNSQPSKDSLPQRKKRKLSYFSEREKDMIVNVYEYVKKSWPTDKYPYKQEMKKTAADIFGIATSSVYRVLKEMETGTKKSKASASSKESNKKKKPEKTPECDENSSDIEDEYDIWAKECACELRQMNPEQQTFAKRAISYILMEGRLGLLHRNTVPINNPRKIPDHQSIQKGPNDSLLDDFLVISQTETRSVATAAHKLTNHPSHVNLKPSDKTGVSNFVITPSKTVSASSPLDDAPFSIVVASHREATPLPSSLSAVKTKSLCNIQSKPVVVRQDIGGSAGLSPLLVKAEPCDSTKLSSRDITEDVSLAPLLVKTEPCDNAYEIVAPFGSSQLFVKRESCDDSDSATLSASPGSVASIRISPSIAKSEQSPPLSSSGFTIAVVKEDPE